MKIQELLESTSLDTTVKAIVADINSSVSQVYDAMKNMATTYVNNRGDLKGFKMLAGGIGSRWYQTMYFNKLQGELYDLVKYVPNHTGELKQFLRGEESKGKIQSPATFSLIASQLPEILEKIGQRINSKDLSRTGKAWAARRTEYENYLDELELDASDDSDGYEEPKAPKEKPTHLGQQNQQAELIASQIISRLPSKIAGDIRNAIARSPNKLQALQQELQKRGIDPNAVGESTDIRLTKVYYYDRVDQPDIAKEIGMKEKNGRWYIPFYNTSGDKTIRIKLQADRLFGQGRAWQPK